MANKNDDVADEDKSSSVSRNWFLIVTVLLIVGAAAIGTITAVVLGLTLSDTVLDDNEDTFVAVLIVLMGINYLMAIIVTFLMIVFVFVVLPQRASYKAIRAFIRDTRGWVSGEKILAANGKKPTESVVYVFQRVQSSAASNATPSPTKLKL